MRNIVYIATSIDGYIADKNNNIEWLHAVPNPENSDMGYGAHMAGIDALVMGRNTFESVLGFDIDWPYDKPVFVLSRTLTRVPEGYEDKVFLINGLLKEVVAELNRKGFNNLYIDGGVTIQNFLKDDLIDEMIITTIPVVLGGGSSLFGVLDAPLHFKCISSHQLIGALCQSHYIREKTTA